MEQSVGADILPCEPAVDGPLTREPTRANFHNVIERTTGGDESKAREQPGPPRVYRRIRCNDARIGFVATLDTDGTLYLVTMQLAPDARGPGLGPTLMHGLEAKAVAAGKEGARLCVFDQNPARRLHDRLGYEVVGDDAWSHTREKRLGA